MAIERFRVVAVDETHCWDDTVLAKYHIGKAFGLYLIREGEATFCCSTQPSSWAVALGNEFIFDFDLDHSLRSKVIDEFGEVYWKYSDDPLEYIRHRPYDNGLETESLEDCYIDFVRVDSHDPRFITDAVDFDIDEDEHGSPGDRSLNSGDESYHCAAWEQAREYFQENAHHPGILAPDTYLAYETEQRAKRRAENLPPLSGRDQLPLFVVATHRTRIADMLGKGWLSRYEEDWFARHPEEMVESDARRGL